MRLGSAWSRRTRFTFACCDKLPRGTQASEYSQRQCSVILRQTGLTSLSITCGAAGARAVTAKCGSTGREMNEGLVASDGRTREQKKVRARKPSMAHAATKPPARGPAASGRPARSSPAGWRRLSLWVRSESRADRSAPMRRSGSQGPRTCRFRIKNGARRSVNTAGTVRQAAAVLTMDKLEYSGGCKNGTIPSHGPCRSACHKS